MQSSYCEVNFFAGKEEPADNTWVLSKDLTKNTEKLTSKNQLGLPLYSPYLTANATSLTGSYITDLNLLESKNYLKMKGLPCKSTAALFNLIKCPSVRN